MNEITFDEAIDRIVAAGSPYAREAYELVREALDHTVVTVHGSAPHDEATTVETEDPEGEQGSPEEARISHHVSGAQLCEGFREVALAHFGPLARTVLEEWNVNATRDIGEMVYQVIETGAFGKEEDDSVEDFDEVYDFEIAFVKPFLPPSVREEGPAEPAAAKAGKARKREPGN